MQFKTKEIKTDIKTLIKEFECMEIEDKLYWIDLLPSMTEGQKEKLENIIKTYYQKQEQNKREKEQELKALNEKHLKEWEEFYK